MGLFDNLKRQAENLLKTEFNQVSQNAVNTIKNKAQSSANTKTVTLSALPKNADEMKALAEFDLSDPFKVAALCVCALDCYSKDREAAKQMLNTLKGPEPLSPRELQFINDRFMDGNDYVTRSYFSGSSPENNYTATQPYSVSIIEYGNSRENEGYIRLYLNSSGADSPRPVVLRHKPSTNEWFLWEFDALLSGVRQPKSADKWA